MSLSVRSKILAKKCLKAVWVRRHGILRVVRRCFGAVGWVYHKIPLPQKVRLVIKDIFFLSLEQLVLNTQAYHGWLRTRNGTGRIHALLGDLPNEHDTPAPSPNAPSTAAWQELVDLGKTRADKGELSVGVDVVVPVYRGYDETLNCLYQALATPNTTDFELIVINDCSPEPTLCEKLRELAEMKLFTLLENKENLGFVQTVNKGMALHPQRDIVLLNADTEVYHDWLDRLLNITRNDPRIGTVTPLSNNAEICSYPHTVRDNPMALEVDFPTLDALAASVNGGVLCDMPTAVGFCMVITRACLKDVGYFDAETFGKGYGEENDFCLRASAKGWRHVLTGNTFVRHLGGTSFAGEKHARVMAALDILNKRYPHYHAEVAKFIEEDPARLMRMRLDAARLAHTSHSQNVLMCNHNLGGGTLRNVIEMCDTLAREQIGSFIMEPAPGAGRTGVGALRLYHPHLRHTPNLVFSMEYDQAELLDVLRLLKVSHLHIHHVIGFEHRILDLLQRLTSELKLAYDVTIHDYFTICPRINLVDERNHYCGEPDVRDCERCIERNHSHAGNLPVWQWRMHFSAWLEAARMVFVPSRDVETRMRRYYPKANFALRYHPEAFDNGQDLHVTAPSQDDPLVIAIIGAISDIKGAQLLRELAAHVRERKLPLKFVVIGHTSQPDLNAGASNLVVTGAYKEDEMPQLLQTHRPHLAFIPSVWPETYCYTLSIAWRFAITPVVFDIGAPAERVRDCGHGIVLPLALKDDLPALADRLMQFKLHGWEHSTARPMNKEYASLWGEYYGMA